jgi:hypothetical protein
MGEGAHAGTAMGQTGRTGRRSGFLEFGRLELCQWADDLCRWRDDFSSLKVTRQAGDFLRVGSEGARSARRVGGRRIEFHEKDGYVSGTQNRKRSR